MKKRSERRTEDSSDQFGCSPQSAFLRLFFTCGKSSRYEHSLILKLCVFLSLAERAFSARICVIG